MNTITRTARSHRSLVMLATVLSAALVLAAPAGAQPVGPDDEIAPQPDPDPDPEVALQAFDRCDPEPGVIYEAAVLGGPDDRPFTVRVDWTNSDTGDAGSSDGASGSIDTGEGTVHLVAVVNYPAMVTLEGDQLAAISISSAEVVVTVDCPDEPEEKDPKEKDPKGEPNPVDPDVRSATPTFTG